ncbi:hypothetical protein [Phenylobacterium sp.]|uniref:hypothetical protein n=1 Tax=Phenylobacterium sp. TaxID=1871053 RepID=UPI002DEFD0F7|nr:hypothetical protein [Phenylobacterium sp.]
MAALQRLTSVLRRLGRVGLAPLFALGFSGLAAGSALAVPSFAIQTDHPCQACHVGGFGPQLTPYGRDFKLHGYIERAGPWNVPFSAMAVASYLRTSKDQASPPANGFSTNNNAALDQVSLFLAGGLGPHLGGFVQTTYDGVAKAWSWDNLDLRATTVTHIKDTEVVLGLGLNNSPGVQDAWNTLPAWGFPYTRSALAPSPSASPLYLGGLAQKTLGASAYAWINSAVYVEVAGYGSPNRSSLARLGADPFAPGDIKGLAPYGRVALQGKVAGGTVEVGAFGMRTDIHPGRDRLTGATDRYDDLGLDSSYQNALDSGDVLSFDARILRERQTLSATCALMGPVGPNCADARLTDLRADVSYYWRDKVGATIALFDTYGPANADLYPDNRTLKPDSSGVTLQLDGTPWGEGKSPLGPRFNMRVGVQYTLYSRFNGASKNFDGAGANASDNNTMRIFAWFAY